MNPLKKHLLLFCAAFLACLSAKAQLPNDICTGAQNLGSLGVPAACPSGLGAPSVFNLSNVGAQEESTWSTISSCDPNGTSSITPTTDVWYYFVNNGLSLTIDINGLQNPSVILYNDACNTIRDCAVGSGGALNFTVNQMNVGQTYYLQINGGDAFDQGAFTLTMQNSNGCDECLISSNLTVNPASVNGTYQAGTTVTFCYTISQWTMVNTNWLHGVVPTFGSGWDLTTLTTVAPPTCDGGTGVWQWFTNLNTNNGLPGHTNGIQTGFFFDGNDPLGVGPDGDPTNNYGDRCGTPEVNDPLGPAPAPNWVFCWTITAKDCPPGQNGDDLGVVINTFGDGETGVWDDVGCVNDPAYTFNASLLCCTPPTMAHTDVACFGDNDGTATATGQGVAPFDYVWKNSANTVIQTALAQPGANTISGLAGGTYTVTVSESNGCTSTQTVTIAEPTQLQLLIATTPAACNLADGTGTVTPQGGTGPYDFVWQDANGTNVQTDNNLPGASNATGLAQGSYDIDVTDANGCTASVTINVQGSQGNLQAQVIAVPTTCPNVCDGSATLNIVGGTIPYVITWDANANNQIGSNAINLCNGTYTVNYADANGCSGSTTATITEPAGLVAQFISSPQTTDIFNTEINFIDYSTGSPTQWNWQFDAFGSSTDQNPTFTFPPVPACYEIILTANNDGNCPDSDTSIVCITPSYSIYFPSAFTPNADGINSGFIGYGEGILEFNMWIFDRWGNMIYHTADMTRPWDGRKEGSKEICMMDIYVYKARVKDIFNQVHDYYGKVALIK